MTALETFARIVQATGPARTISETEPEIAYFKDQWQNEWGYHLMLYHPEECQIMVFPQADTECHYFEIFTVPLPIVDHVAQGRAHNALCALKDRTPSELWRKARAAEEDLDSLLSHDPGEAPEEDTQPGVPLDLGTVQLTPIPQLEFTELLRRLKALKADLEALGCTVKLTGPDGKEIQA